MPSHCSCVRCSTSPNRVSPEVVAFADTLSSALLSEVIESALPRHSVDSKLGKLTEKKFAFFARLYARVFQAHMQEADALRFAELGADIVRESAGEVMERMPKKADGQTDYFPSAMKAIDKAYEPMAKAVTERVKATAESTYKDAYQTAYAETWNGEKVVAIEKARAYARKNAGRLCDDLTKTDQKRIARCIADGLADGSTHQQMADAIFDAVRDDNFTEGRAKVIAATESNAALAQGAHDAAIDFGYDEKTWVDIEGACEVCADNANEGAIAIDATFPSEDDVPPAHPNCRCFIQYSMTEKPDKEDES